MANVASIPSLTGEGNLSRYLDEIRKFPMLSADEEFMLAKACVAIAYSRRASEARRVLRSVLSSTSHGPRCARCDC